MAFVVLSAKALKEVAKDPAKQNALTVDIIKVRSTFQRSGKRLNLKK